jgi:DNA-binding winged helix-turn-helix (wHTH) protein
VEKEREYLHKLLNTQKVIFDILISLLRNPVEEKTTKNSRIYRPYSNYQRDEKALALCLFEQDKYAQSHGFKIIRFGPERRPIQSVKDVFRWCVDIAREYGPTFIEGVDREECWQWYERLLRWETDILPPEWLLKIKLGLSGPILLFIGVGEHYAITADTRGTLYRQLEEIRARVKTFHHVAVGIPAEGFGAKREVNTIQAKGILGSQKTPASQEDVPIKKEEKTGTKLVEANKTTGDLTFGKSTVTLHTLDIKLLACLNEAIGKTVSRNELMFKVWGDDPHKHPYEDQLYIRIRNLREAFKGLKIPTEINTIHRAGYKLVDSGITFDIQ